MKITFLDVETTGLLLPDAAPLVKQPRVIEIYMRQIDITTGESQTLDTLVDPEMSIDKDITRITGLTNMDLKGQLKWVEIVNDIIDLIESSDEIVAHNLAFDKALIDYECARMDETVDWPVQLTCTVESTEYIFGYRLSLSNLVKHVLKKDLIGAHRARVDVEAMIKCFFRLRATGGI